MVDAQTHLLPLAIFLTMTAIGIELEWRQFVEMARRPRAPIVGTIIHTLTFPLLAVLLVSTVVHFELAPSDALLAGILLIAACPSGGFSNVLVLFARADLVLSVSLTAVSSLLSFFTVPLFVNLFGYLLPSISTSVTVPVGETLVQLLILVVLPVVAGMILRYRFPRVVIPRIQQLQKWTQLFLYVVVIMTLTQQWDGIGPAIPEALPWAVGLCIAVLGTGYLVAKVLRMSEADAATIAIEGSVRNLGVAFLIAATVLERLDIAVLPAVYFGAVLVVGLGFARLWRASDRKRRGGSIRIG